MTRDFRCACGLVWAPTQFRSQLRHIPIPPPHVLHIVHGPLLIGSLKHNPIWMCLLPELVLSYLGRELTGVTPKKNEEGQVFEERATHGIPQWIRFLVSFAQAAPPPFPLGPRSSPPQPGRVDFADASVANQRASNFKKPPGFSVARSLVGVLGVP